MFYTGLNPYTLEEVYVPKSPKEKAMQRALLQYFNPKNKDTVVKALLAAGRSDLIGTGKNCLVTPPPGFNTQKTNQKGKGSYNGKKCSKVSTGRKPNSKNKLKGKKVSPLKEELDILERCIMKTLIIDRFENGYAICEDDNCNFLVLCLKKYQREQKKAMCLILMTKATLLLIKLKLKTEKTEFRVKWQT